MRTLLTLAALTALPTLGACSSIDIVHNPPANAVPKAAGVLESEPPLQTSPTPTSQRPTTLTPHADPSNASQLQRTPSTNPTIPAPLDATTYAAELRRLAADPLTDPLTEEEIAELQRQGLRLDFLRTLRTMGDTTPPKPALRLQQQGFRLDRFQALRNAGYDVSATAALRAQQQGLSTDYARHARMLGYSLSLAELQSLQDHGVSRTDLSRIAAEQGTLLTPAQIRAARNNR